MPTAISRNEAPLASHLLYTQPNILDENKPEERKLGIECGYVWMACASLVVFYCDYGMSFGMDKALERASKLKIPVEFRRIGKNS